MERATIERHDRREDAIASAEALRAIGLAQSEVGLVYLLGAGFGPAQPDPEDAATSEPTQVVTIPDLGRAAVTGWLIERQPSSSISDATSWLHSLLAPAEPSDAELQRLVAALRTGGGVVSVRSKDADDPTVRQVLLGRKA